MENEILKMAASQGFFAVLFVALLFYVLQQNAKREESYQKIITELTEKFSILDNVRRNVEEIKDNLKK